ncbi:MAG TPA: UDP-N-acetylmuramate dehydrogenase [Bacteroidales bacterium]|nr:UDP-N-acetylmuramate dehydrogenase [Bacteroidales bacterium]
MDCLLENISLKKYNTFGVEARARYFIELSSVDQIRDFIQTGQFKTLPRLILGEGSNILFTRDFDGIVIRPLIKGIKMTGETAKHVHLQVGAGENWDGFVKYCVENNWGGLENLSLIPGSVGASPVQNIGAYGVEVKDAVEYVEVIELSGNRIVKYAASECMFDYRNSIFKKNLKNKIIITSVAFRLDKDHRYVTNYGDVEKELDKYPETNLQNIRQVVMNIRSGKLPDPAKLGNAGSFFKNPVVNSETLEHIRQFYPKVPCWETGKNQFKISAVWLIEQCHWGRKKIGQTGTYLKQPLVIVNYGQATGKDILNLARKIQRAVKNHFAIPLEPEVNIV